MKKGGFNEQTMYRFDELDSVLSSVDSRDDLLALSIAISQVKNRPIGPWILDSGPLPPQNFDQFKLVFVRGLHEVETFLNEEGVL